MAIKPILRSKEYLWQINPENPKHIRGSTLEKLKDFLATKRSNLTNKFGSNDKLFAGDGIFQNNVPGLAHAHLTHDLSIVYRVRGNQLELYGIYNHDSLGTGQPPNINRRKSMATRFAGMNLTE